MKRAAGMWGRAPGVIVIAGALGASLSASAAPGSLTINDVPEASLPEAPAFEKRPKSVPAGTKVQDLNIGGTGLVQPVAPRRHGRSQAAQAPMPAQQQTELTAGENACVSVTSQGRDAFRTTQLFVDPHEGVVPVRVETLKETGDTAVLTVVDAWVDSSTLGALEIARTAIKMKKLAKGPFEAAAYGFRSKGVLTMVIPAGMNSQLHMSDGRFVSASCNIARAELPTERGKGATLNGFFMRNTPALEAKDGLAAVPPMSVRIGLAASSSQTSRDPDPLISVVLRPLDELPPVIRQRLPQTE